jgi:hypothetical protein
MVPMKNAPVRWGYATLEVVMATAVALPVAAALLHLAFVGCRQLYDAIGALVGWPYL